VDRLSLFLDSNDLPLAADAIERVHIQAFKTGIQSSLMAAAGSACAPSWFHSVHSVARVMTRRVRRRSRGLQPHGRTPEPGRQVLIGCEPNRHSPRTHGGRANNPQTGGQPRRPGTDHHLGFLSTTLRRRASSTTCSRSYCRLT
jgi:hypothetical protein